MTAQTHPDIIIFKNGWISPRSPAGRKACGPRGGVQCNNAEAAIVWAEARKLVHQTAEQVTRNEAKLREPQPDGTPRQRLSGRRVASYRHEMRTR